MLRVPHRRIAGRPGYWSWLLVALVVVAVAHRRLGPSSSASTSTMDRALPSSAVQLLCWSRPTTTTRLPLDSDSTACSAWSRHTTTVKNDASCSRLPETATRNMARGDSALGVTDLGLVGEVAGEAHGGLGHGSCPFLLPGRAVCPALGPGGRWTPWHARRPPEASGGANEVGHVSGLPADGRLGCRVGWWGACGWGSGMPAPSGQIPPPWAWWENEAPATRAARRPVPGSSRRVFLHRVGCHR
jgi:hypothetical protein